MKMPLGEENRVGRAPSLKARLFTRMKARIFRPFHEIKTTNGVHMSYCSRTKLTHEINPDEINWYALKAVINWENASEWRRWELLTRYGRR